MEANLFPLEYEKDDEDHGLLKDHDHDVEGALPYPGPTLQRVSCRDRQVLSHSHQHLSRTTPAPNPTAVHYGSQNPGSKVFHESFISKRGRAQNKVRIPNLDIPECFS